MASWMPACATSVARTPSFCRPAMTISLPVTVSIAVMRMNISTTNSSTVISAAPRSRAWNRGTAEPRNRDLLTAFNMNLSIFLTNSSSVGSLPAGTRSVTRHRLARQQDLLHRKGPALHHLRPLRLQGHRDHTAGDRDVKALNHRRNSIAAARRHGECITWLREGADHPLQLVRSRGPGDAVTDVALPDRRVRPPGGNRLRTRIRRRRHVAARECKAPRIVAHARRGARV